jgi:hypothetical protein
VKGRRGAQFRRDIRRLVTRQLHAAHWRRRKNLAIDASSQSDGRIVKKRPKRTVPKKRVPVPPGPPSLPTGVVSLDDIYDAYRKAKVDVFFERSQPMGLAFSEYERNLQNKLASLLAKLTSPHPTWMRDPHFIGSFGFIPKGLKIPPYESSGQPHFSLSDPEDAWKYLLKRSKAEKPRAAFRPVAHFTVDMYIVCALWVNLIGHKYDACLDTCAHGSRLRRLRGSTQSKGSAGQYHVQAPGSFQPYFYCYREWREQGLKAIRHELTEGRRVVALTMDLTSFYHSVDPRFLLHDVFLKKARFRSVNGKPLSENERLFTEHLVTAFETWANQLPDIDSGDPPGVPVGPSAPRVIANVLLLEFDRLILKQLAPIYYGRYVDDIFLVLRDTGAFTSADKVISHLVRRIRPLEMSDDRSELRLKLPYAEKSRLLFKTEKQRVFLLSGEVGEDLLDAIESKIDEVSSEWRLLPNLNDLERSPAARVLTAAKLSNEDADSLRKADELSLRRLGFALMLRSVDALARDLPPSEWVTERKRFYRFASRHVLTPLRLLDLNDYLPRLLGLAIACQDWTEARNMVLRIVKVVKGLRLNITVDPSGTADEQWDGYTRHLKRALLEAVVCSYPFHTTGNGSTAAERVVEAINALSVDLDDFFDDLFADSCAARAREMFWSDLSRTPFKESLIEELQLPPTETKLEVSALPPKRREKADVIEKFLTSMGTKVDSLGPLLFPTRPLTASEITECLPQTVQDLALLGDLVQAIRGTWAKPQALGATYGSEEDIIEIGFVANEEGANRNYKPSD